MFKIEHNLLRNYGPGGIWTRDHSVKSYALLSSALPCWATGPCKIAFEYDLNGPEGIWTPDLLRFLFTVCQAGFRIKVLPLDDGPKKNTNKNI